MALAFGFDTSQARAYRRVAPRVSLPWRSLRFSGCDHWPGAGSDISLESAARVHRALRSPVLFAIVHDRRAYIFVPREA